MPDQPSANRPDRRETTPPADMQPEDAGTAASGADADRAPTEPAMKQQQKTPQEQGSERPGGQR
ncbi:MAG: hypothetical protein HY854_07005 [Burkholderiales bacterium]|nr:hypothetical protein [Burkholderiales bacterium]